jgi:tetratricopeptide (TPR) repeat protein
VTLNLIAVLRFQKKYAASEEYCRKMIASHPEFAEGYAGVGDICFDQNDLGPAIEYYQKAIERKPDYAEAYSNLGSVFSKLGRMGEAEEYYNKAIACDPDHVNAHCNLSLLQLTLGDYEHGLHHYEWRFRHSAGAVPIYPGEQWKGQKLNGERVLLYDEQGLGDSLQFLRYLPQVRNAGATVHLAISKPLRRLVEQLEGIEAFYYPGDLLGPYEYQCALMSLPKAFHTRPETIPATGAYMKVPAEAQQAADALAWPEKGLRVGLVWAGNPNHSNDSNRSIPLRELAPLWRVEGVHFYSLQIGAGEAERAEAAGPLIDLTEGIEDFADTAARLMKLDLLIAVDTSVVHMAGSLGRPVWTMLPFVPDWRWFLDRSDSPWYPSMRLFRQKQIGDWASVVEPIRAALAERAAQGQGGAQGLCLGA